MKIALPPAPAFGQPVANPQRQEVLDFIATRRSASAVTLRAPGPDAAQIADLLRLAARAPDHGKLAPWRFIVLEGQDKTAFADRLGVLAASRGETTAVAKLAKLRIPPVGIFVISSPKEASIREWEQVLSAGAVCVNLLYAAMAMGFGANWITDWYSYDPQALEILGLGHGEKVAGLILMGAAGEPPLERERPEVAALITQWRG